MPYINIETSSKVEKKKELIEEISILVSSLTKKSKKFIMAKLDDDCEMYFDDSSPCCFIEIKSIGSLNPSVMAKEISDFVHQKIDVPIDKIYISFEDICASNWAWNGKTFG